MITWMTDFLAALPAEWILNIVLAVNLGLLAACLIGFDWVGLGGVNNKLKKVQNAINLLDVSDRPGNLAKVGRILDDSNFEPLTIAWENGLVRDQEGTTNAVRDIQEHFRATPIIVIPARRRSAEIIPGLLAGIGLFGAVLCLLGVFSQSQIRSANGLVSIDRSLLFKSLPDVIMLLALSILIALIFLIVDRQMVGRVQLSLTRLQSTLTQKLPIIDDTQLLRTIAEDQKILSAHVSESSDRIGDRLTQIIQHELIPTVLASFKSAIDEQLNPSIKTMNLTIDRFAQQAITLQNSGMEVLAKSFADRLDLLFVQQLSQLSQMVKSMTQLHETSANRVQTLLAGIEQAVSLQTEVNNETASAISSLAASRSQLTETAAVLDLSLTKTGELAGIIGTLLESDRQMVDRLRSERDSMQVLNNGYFDQMSKQILQMQEDLHSEIESIFAHFTEIYTTTFEHIEESTHNLMQSYSEGGVSVMASMNEQVRDLGFLTREINAEIALLNETLKSSVNSFGEQIQLNTQSTFDSFDAGISSITQKLAATAEVIRDSVDDLPAAVLAVRGYLTNSEEVVNEAEA